MILSGKAVADRILGEAKDIVSGLSVRPGFGVVLVGDNPASRLYVGIKERRAAELGFIFRKEVLPTTATEDEIIRAVDSLNVDRGIHGILVQLPLPDGLDTDLVIAAIDPKKDADGFHPDTVRKFLAGDRDSIPVFPEAIMELATSADVVLSGKKGIAIVNSDIFGGIMKKAFEYEGMSAIIVKAEEIDGKENEIREGDVIVTAIGQPGRFKRSIFKKGAIIIDGGISERDGNVYGDVSAEGDDADIFLAPVPGGVGPVTVACLLRRVVRLAVG
ncbi:MAG: bifunctional 5,10-methylenetetrahydrofolate dehydrogenase/5,10-methenyltetrahydrofolate cyclohydrolase [Candidatus Moranbacteria bacterium]|nr:bifunctional 5,10-methylenetetrahydrofolate dehydrogenase/5,10-methenyltetrahydrofolate cyclohydrolase [Candidatus Moranbacteria bacterium]